MSVWKTAFDFTETNNITPGLCNNTLTTSATLRLGLCHNTLTPATTLRLGPCHNTLTPATTLRLGLCHNTLTPATTLMIGSQDRRSLQLFSKTYYYASPTLRSETTLRLKKPQHVCYKQPHHVTDERFFY